MTELSTEKPLMLSFQELPWTNQLQLFGKPNNLCDLLYCDIYFIVVVWNETCRISEVRLYYLYRTAKVRMTTDISSETMQARGSVATLLTSSKEKKNWLDHSSSILLWLEKACVLYPQLN